jgi:hypothetical protein
LNEISCNLSQERARMCEPEAIRTGFARIASRGCIL